jgi:hypothetical protein
MLTVHTGKGRNRTTHNISHLSRDALFTMTELTQLQMFGEVIHKKYDRSIHPNSRVIAKQNTKRQKVKLKDGSETLVPAGTEPSRTRSGHTYPGGRTLRRAFKRLARRRTGRKEIQRHFPGSMEG